MPRRITTSLDYLVQVQAVQWFRRSFHDACFFLLCQRLFRVQLWENHKGIPPLCQRRAKTIVSFLAGCVQDWHEMKEEIYELYKIILAVWITRHRKNE